MKLYHGSSNIIQQPIYGYGKDNNDYGQGFYCTEHLSLAKEWACTQGVSGYANQYELDLDKMKVLNLSADEYTILHWLTLLIEYRKFRLTTPVMRRGAEWLRENYFIDLSPYDVVIGYRADDSYFSFAKAFINNAISLRQLSYAMKLGTLGEQIVLKSERAFAEIKFVGYEVADSSEYFAKRNARDAKARADYQRELENDDLNGFYMRDILREEVMPDDPRLR